MLMQGNPLKPTTQAVLVALTLSFGAAAFAQSAATPRVDQREANQETRIGQGVASGQLTAREATHLQKRETRIQSNEVAAKADGKVTGAERRQLHREQNRASKAIHRQKHDRQVTTPAG